MRRRRGGFSRNENLSDKHDVLRISRFSWFALEICPMSMEIYLLTDEAVLTTQAWQEALDAL